MDIITKIPHEALLVSVIGSRQPWACVHFGEGPGESYLSLDSAAECDRLIIAATDAKRMLELATAGTAHDFEGGAGQRGYSCKQCGRLQSADAHKVPEPVAGDVVPALGEGAVLGRCGSCQLTTVACTCDDGDDPTGSMTEDVPELAVVQGAPLAGGVLAGALTSGGLMPAGMLATSLLEQSIRTGQPLKVDDDDMGALEDAAAQDEDPADDPFMTGAGVPYAPAAASKPEPLHPDPSIIGRIVAFITDDSPSPATGRVIGQVDEDYVDVAWGDQQDADYPSAHREAIDELRPVDRPAVRPLVFVRPDADPAAGDGELPGSVVPLTSTVIRPLPRRATAAGVQIASVTQ